MRRRSSLIVTLLIATACSRARVHESLNGFRHDGPVVLITIDTLRLDRVGAYGSTRGLTPNLDALARSPNAAVFLNAVAQVPLTLPSHATILTGLHPQRHGVRTNDGFRLGDATPTLADAFRRAGFATGAFVGGYPVNAGTGLARGFDRYDDEFVQRGANERRADEVIAPALAWIRDQMTRQRARWFVWIHLFDPHSPYEPPAEFLAAHRDQPYDGEVAYTDAAIGRFFEQLRRNGVFDRALIVVVADHGESLGDHNERTHGTFLYDSTIHVPLIVRLPIDRAFDMRAPVMAPVESADISPTLAAIAGLTLGTSTDGLDIRSLLGGGTIGAPAARRRAAYAESYYQNVLLGWSPLRALRGSDWKFIEAPRPELYDLEHDGDESRNVIGDHASIARAMAGALPPATPPGAPAAAPTPDAAGRLQSLGYVAGRTELGTTLGADPKDKIAVWNAIEEGIDAVGSRPAAAEAAFERAERLDPGNGLALKGLADLSFRAGQWQVAADRYRRALAAGFRHPDVFVNLASIAERRGQFDEARRYLNDAAAAQPSDADVWNRLGLLDARRGDLDAARSAFERAVAVAPTRSEPHYNLGIVERRAGNEAAAQTRLQEAIALNPKYAEARYALATGYLAAGQAMRALAEYREALAIRPDYPEALFGAGRAALALGQNDEARRDYEQFVRVAPREYAQQKAAAENVLRRLSAAR